MLQVWLTLQPCFKGLIQGKKMHNVCQLSKATRISLDTQGQTTRSHSLPEIKCDLVKQVTLSSH